MIDDEALLDALDDFRQCATPKVLEWVQRVAQAEANYAARSGGTAADVAGFNALRELARVVAESGK